MVRHKESIISGLVLMADNSLGYSMTIEHYKQRKEQEENFFFCTELFLFSFTFTSEIIVDYTSVIHTSYL